jgi:hypothetical protein
MVLESSVMLSNTAEVENRSRYVRQQEVTYPMSITRRVVKVAAVMF